MKTRCPVCGAENSLDALVAHEAARENLWQLARFGGELPRLMIQYLGLFRPEKSALSMPRMAALLAELLPMIEKGEISRRGQTVRVTDGMWAAAFAAVLAARDNGSLKLPLKTHGYLFEILAGMDYAPQLPQVVEPASVPVNSKARLAYAALNDWANS